MSHRPLELLLACPLVLVACGDNGSASTGVSGTSLTSATVTATATATASGTGTGTATDSSTGGSGSASTGDDPTTGAVTGTTTSGSTTDPATGTSNSSNNTTSTTSDSNGTTTTTTNSSDDSTTGDCASVSETAMNKKQPADIIFAIDNSGSMDMEIASVVANMNNFSQQIINSGIDVHVIVISDNSVCIAAPLGSGNCPADSKPPTYVRINDGVGSSNALDKLIQHYPTYSQYLRPDAATHVVVVTDDNANMNANTFDAMWKALEPGMADYKFHAICGKNDVDDFLWCAQNPACCAFTAEAGDVYLDLIALTGGKWGDLCLQNFTPVFNELSTQVVMGATLACEWTIPEPMGEPIDFNKVNVEFDDGVPPNDVFGKVNDPAECANVSDGWYYDNPQMPTKIFVCPQTCDKIQGVQDAKINIQFGCETIIAQ